MGGAGPTRRSENEPCHPCSSRNNYPWRVVCILRGSLKSGRPYVPRHCLSHGHCGPSYVLHSTHRGYRDCVCNLRMEDPASAIIYWTDCYDNRSSFLNMLRRRFLCIQASPVYTTPFSARTARAGNGKFQSSSRIAKFLTLRRVHRLMEVLQALCRTQSP